ncbi:hypothetical protein [Terasakiispira papahanaumokuakeensis]|nr:hypothetical protein [Terasakiispira papahanaumokuakeensis]
MPLLVILGIQLGYYGLAESVSSSYAGVLLLKVIFGAFDIAVFCWVFVNTTRSVMLNEPPARFKLKPHARDIKCFIYCAAFVGLWTVASMLMGLSVYLIAQSVVFTVIPLLILMAMLWLSLRLSPALVGIALDNALSLKAVFRLTQSLPWAAFFAFVIVTVLSYAFSFMMRFIANLVDLYWVSLTLFWVVIPLVEILISVVATLMLGILYAELHQPTTPPSHRELTT